MKAKNKSRLPATPSTPQPRSLTDADLDRLGEIFAHLLVELREATGADRADVAERAGLSYQAVRMHELGQRAPGFETLFKLERGYARSAEWLLREVRRRFGRK